MEITETDILDWEIQLRREGALPVEVQVALLETIKGLVVHRRSPIVNTERSRRL